MNIITQDYQFKQIVPISDLPRNYLRLLKKANYTNEPVILFRRNKPAGVLMDYNLWEEYSEFKRQFELADALDMAQKGREAYKEGETKELKNFSDLWKDWDEI